MAFSILEFSFEFHQFSPIIVFYLLYLTNVIAGRRVHEKYVETHALIAVAAKEQSDCGNPHHGLEIATSVETLLQRQNLHPLSAPGEDVLPNEASLAVLALNMPQKQHPVFRT